MTSPFQCVVDTNIAIKQFIDDPLTEKVNKLFERLAKNPLAQFHVPDLFYVECANVLMRYVRANQCSAEEAALDLADLKALRIRSTPTKLLIIEAADISAKYDISAYDGSYVALSHQVKAPLLTLDKRLFNSMKGSAFDVCLFTDSLFLRCLPTHSHSVAVAYYARIFSTGRRHRRLSAHPTQNRLPHQTGRLHPRLHDQSLQMASGNGSNRR